MSFKLYYENKSENNKDILIKFPFTCNSRYIYDIKYHNEDYHCRGIFKYLLYFHFNREMLKMTQSQHRKYSLNLIDEGDAFFLMSNLIIDNIDIIPSKSDHGMNPHEKTLNNLYFHITVTKKHSDRKVFPHRFGGETIYYEGRFTKSDGPLDHADINNLIHMCAHRFESDLKNYISLYKLPTNEEYRGSFTRIDVNGKKIEYDASDIFERVNKMYEMWIENYVDIYPNPQSEITIPY